MVAVMLGEILFSDSDSEPCSMVAIVDEENSISARNANLDETDFEILRQLQNNARLSNKALAERVGLAPSTTIVRTRQLERAGIIRGYRAAIDPGALGVGLQALIAVRLHILTSSRSRSTANTILACA